ncbi:MAG: hypothetical protein IJW32_02620 [Clostridia bacterium]|nr:hypothetical protein [Clostridia bacterium]MBQ9792624.1 hypothetical protein [Clostridia bacterium]
MLFNGEEHEKFYNDLIEGFTPDPYYYSLFYLLSLTEDTRKNFHKIYNIAERKVRPQCLRDPWQTGTTIAITRLALNLFNGFTGLNGEFDDVRNYTADNIFCRKDLMKYFFQAIAIRFE